jgi:hypothetical protein
MSPAMRLCISAGVWREAARERRTPDSGAIYRESQSGCVRLGALPRNEYDATECARTSPERVLCFLEPIRIPPKTRSDSFP